MAVRNLKAKELTGKNIYQIKNQTIYSNRFMKDYGYQIPDYEADKYRSYSLRGFESIFGFILLLFVVKNNILIPLTVSVLAYIVLSFFFFFKYLPTLPKVENFKKEKRDNYIVSTAKEMTAGRILVITLLCAIFSLAIIYYPINNNYEGTFRIILFILGGASSIFTIMNLISVIYKLIKKI